MSRNAIWRPMLPEDLKDVERLATDSHPGLPEDIAVFAERLTLFPAGCSVLDQDGTVQGYIISHPILRDEPPDLNNMLGNIHKDADTYYIHDLVVANQLRGRGLAASGIVQALATAAREGFVRTCIISVYGTADFWSRYGFQRQEATGVMARKLLGYGPDAVYMVRYVNS